MKKLQTIGYTLAQKTKILRKQTRKSLLQNPLRFFYASLLAFVILIGIGNLIRKPAPEKKAPEIQPLAVQTYNLGGSPHVAITGEVEKSGVIKIVALTSGVVSKINFAEGTTVPKGATILNIASNYSGGNSFSVQRQLAAVQYAHVLDTYDSQKALISQQKEVANTAREQSDELRTITKDSIQSTKDLISLNGSIISKLDSNLTTLQADPITNADLILASQQVKSQFLAAQNQTNSALKQAEYQSGDDNEPVKLSQLQRDATVKQLELQEKMLDMQKEVSRLQLSLARITEGMTAPSAPFRGVVQRVYVKKGEVVNPGTVLAIVSQTKNDPITIVAYVSRDIAQKVSTYEPARLTIQNEVVSLMPKFVSQDAVESGLYAIYFELPDSYLSKVTEKDHITIDLSLTTDKLETALLYIPIDAVHQTSTFAYVFVEKNGKATARKVTLGTVFGSLVQAKGISSHEHIILDRSVTEGTLVSISQK